MITTDSDETAARLRCLRTHGQSKQYHHEVVGTNSRLDEIQAAILRVKFRHLEDWNRKREEHAAFYEEQLQGLPLALPKIDSGNDSIYHQYVILAEERDRLKAHLHDRGIGTAVYYPVPLPLQPCFSALQNRPGDFPEAERCAAQSLALPVYAEMTRQQQEAVVSAIRSFFE
jgi:dTDP-4-amino-4,6-dideoxygalactose transaminase